MTNHVELVMMEGGSIQSSSPPNQPIENVLECDPFIFEHEAVCTKIALKDRTDLTDEQKAAIMNPELSTDNS